MKADSRVALPSASRFRSASHQPSANGSPVTVLCTYSTVINCTEDGVPPSFSPTIRLLNWLIESLAQHLDCGESNLQYSTAVQYSVYCTVCTVRTVPRRSPIGHGITSSTEIAQQGQPVHCSTLNKGRQTILPIDHPATEYTCTVQSYSTAHQPPRTNHPHRSTSNRPPLPVCHNLNFPSTDHMLKF